MLATAACLRCVRISRLNLAKTCQAQVGDKCNKNAAVTERQLRSNLLDNACQAQGVVDGMFLNLHCSRQNSYIASH